jgi:ATP-dependent Lon protease
MTLTKEGKVIGVVAQKDESVEKPSVNDIYKTGTVARILKVLKMPDGNTTVIIQGKKRFQINEIISEKPYLTATISDLPESKPTVDNEEFNAIIDSIKDLSLEIIKESPNIQPKQPLPLKILKAILSW